MKYWDGLIATNLSFNEANRQIEKYRPYYTTRPDWEGVHFYSKQGQYCILFKDGHVETDILEKVWDKDKNDWMIVTITDEAVKILEGNDLV